MVGLLALTPTLLPIPDGVTADAVYDGPFRYRLEWVWNAALPTLTAILLHPGIAPPSLADYRTDKLYRFAQRWGMGRLLIVGVYGLRVAEQGHLERAKDPAGPLNEEHVYGAVTEADMVLLAHGWPVEPAHQQRCRQLGAELSAAGFLLNAFSIRPNHAWPWLPECVGDSEIPKPWKFE